MYNHTVSASGQTFIRVIRLASRNLVTTKRKYSFQKPAATHHQARSFLQIASVLCGNVAFLSFRSIIMAEKVSEDSIRKADELYNKQEFDELYNLLKSQENSGNDEVLWRLARAVYEKSKLVTDSKQKHEMYKEALGYLETAETINDKNYGVHKWLAIIKDCVFTCEGLKVRLSNLYNVKQHMEKACELNPKDGTSLYVLGLWYFNIANISWYERKIASLFFASPPEATFNEALDVFMKAEEVEPNFYSKNLLMIAKCHLQLGNKEIAKEYLQRTKSYPLVTSDDKEAIEEAEKLLNEL